MAQGGARRGTAGGQLLPVNTLNWPEQSGHSLPQPSYIWSLLPTMDISLNCYRDPNGQVLNIFFEPPKRCNELQGRLVLRQERELGEGAQETENDRSRLSADRRIEMGLPVLHAERKQHRADPRVQG